MLGPGVDFPEHAHLGHRAPDIGEPGLAMPDAVHPEHGDPVEQPRDDHRVGQLRDQQRRMADGCHLDRNFREIITSVDWVVESLGEFYRAIGLGSPYLKQRNCSTMTAEIQSWTQRRLFTRVLAADRLGKRRGVHQVRDLRTEAVRRPCMS